MDAATHDLDLDLQLEDELLLDPWFWRTEEEFAQIEDDPTAKILEIKIAPLDQKVTPALDQGTGLDDKLWAF